MMRIALDTNVLGYAEGLDDPDRQRRANEVLDALTDCERALPVQCMAELHRLVVRRRRCSASDAERAVRKWADLLPWHLETTRSVIDLALSLATQHRMQVFDAVILAAAREGGCTILLSEDMADGFAWRGVTIVNPFSARPHPLLADLLT